MIRLMLVGRKGVGKDTVADIICAERPEVARHAFADALKRDTSSLIKYARDKFGVNAPGDVAEMREVMRPFWQWYGTDFVRRFDKEHWLRRFEGSYGMLSNVVVPDCRFENEAAWARRNGFVLCRVEGPDRRVGEHVRTAEHVSETELDKIACDIAIDNTKGLEELRYLVWCVLVPFVESRAFMGHVGGWRR